MMLHTNSQAVRPSVLRMNAAPGQQPGAIAALLGPVDSVGGVVGLPSHSQQSNCCPAKRGRGGGPADGGRAAPTDSSQP